MGIFKLTVRKLTSQIQEECSRPHGTERFPLWKPLSLFEQSFFWEACVQVPH